MKLKELPIVSYLRRYWWVVLVLYITYIGARSNNLFAVLDVFAYLPLAFAAWVALPLLWRNIFNRKTTDHYIDSGDYVKDFTALDPASKVKHTRDEMGNYLIGSAIIVHALLSNLFPNG